MTLETAIWKGAPSTNADGPERHLDILSRSAQ
jgi:hypothetical protein